MLALALAGCVSEFRDGRQIEGTWVGNRSGTAAECDPQTPCERIVEVATQQLLARMPSAQIREVRFHDLPHLRYDGSSVTVTHQTFQIVFTLADNTERVEHFGCDMHGGLMGGIGAPAYAEFCPPPSDGE